MIKETLAEALKSQTTQEHQQAEKTLPLFRPEFTPSEYKKLLNRFLSFYTGYEKAMQQWRNLPLSNMDQRLERSLFLKKDLQAFDEILNSKALDNFKIENLPQALGAMYVVEGSSLGGQVIYKHLKEKLGLQDHVLNFYRGYGVDTGKNWIEFKNYLNSFSNESENFKQDCIQSAKNTFQQFGRSLTY